MDIETLYALFSLENHYRHLFTRLLYLLEAVGWQSSEIYQKVKASLKSALERIIVLGKRLPQNPKIWANYSQSFPTPHIIEIQINSYDDYRRYRAALSTLIAELFLKMLGDNNQATMDAAIPILRFVQGLTSSGKSILDHLAFRSLFWVAFILMEEGNRESNLLRIIID